MVNHVTKKLKQICNEIAGIIQINNPCLPKILLLSKVFQKHVFGFCAIFKIATIMSIFQLITFWTKSTKLVNKTIKMKKKL